MAKFNGFERSLAFHIFSVLSFLFKIFQLILLRCHRVKFKNTMHIALLKKNIYLQLLPFLVFFSIGAIYG